MIGLETTLAAMLHLTPCKYDHESPAARAALLRPLARAITVEARDEEEVAALVTVQHHESHGCKYVLLGHCEQGPEGERCDWDDRTNAPLSLGPFQVRNYCKAAWELPQGTFAGYRAGAHCTLSMLRYGRSRHHTWEGAFSALIGTGACCWSGAEKRLRTMAIVLPELMRAS